MDTVLTTRASFSAGHRLHRGQEHRAHGHLWTIAVATLDGHDWTLENDLIDLVAPFENETMEDMLTGGEASMAGFATWAMERLLLAHAKILWVEVAESPTLSIRVNREIRGPSK